jgi:hypothetical protein
MHNMKLHYQEIKAFLVIQDKASFAFEVAKAAVLQRQYSNV